MGGSCRELVVLITPVQAARARHEVPGRPGVSTLRFMHNLSWEVRLVRSFWRPHSLTRCNHRSPLEAPLNGANGTQAGSLSYINAVASSLQLHGGSFWDSSERSLSPEGQCSIIG